MGKKARHGVTVMMNIIRPLGRRASRTVAGSTANNSRVQSQLPLRRAFCSADEDDQMNAPREALEYDVVIVGAGPAGLSAAIKLKQLCNETDKQLSICVVEKGAEVGSHILSGNVLESRALDELLPDWREMGGPDGGGPPMGTEVKEDKFTVLLGETSSFTVPNFLLSMIKQIDNHGNHIISLSQMCRWLGQQAEEMEIEIYPGFAASEVLYSEDGGVMGIATRDMGIDKDGTAKGTYTRGMEIKGRQVLFAEGARGSCSEELMETFELREAAGADPQTYGLGVKEVWEIPEEKCTPGLVMHTYGWPLQKSLNDKVYGGAFLYHMAPNKVLCGFVVGLDYENPYLSPYQTFQTWKHHPEISKHLEGGECVSYGARVLNEGGFYSIPKLTFPGGALIGCSAGFLNAFKIKGTHTAMKSGMLAAESVFELLTAEDARKSVYDHVWVDGSEEPAVNASDTTEECAVYQSKFDESWVHEELKEVRNFHGGFKMGTLMGFLNAGFISVISKGKETWALRNSKTDSEKTKPAAECEEIVYPKPDGKLSFELLSNLSRSGTNHEDQPSHLRIKPEFADIPANESFPVYAGPEQRFCPAKVYEYTDGSDTDGVPQLVINAQNCVHCKCCSIKMPKEYINWTVPEGAGGPNYDVM